MSDYIKREDARKAACELCDYYGFCRDSCEHHPIDDVHAADVRPVVRGKWVYDHWCEFKCSNCGAWSKSKPYRARENFCPNCGARMDGGQDDV